MTASRLARGRLYRSCGCRDAQRKQYGPRCPHLKTDTQHGSWAYAVDLPDTPGRRTTRRRTGFASRTEAERALTSFTTGEATGVYEEPRLTVGTYLEEWLTGREEHLSPSTPAGYARAAHYDLLPGFGPLRLLDLLAPGTSRNG
ncbi:hypothetical protein ACOKM3_07790 [Streptomyces sp. BH106]|uniref:hypothetical protein n=1 Tax=Streptomyces sp. BH106 TaxID=3410409 RepID=UPI003CEAA288